MSTPSQPLLDALVVESTRSTKQYQRRVSIVVEKVGTKWDFSLFRCRFEVRKGDRQTPNTCDLRIYNLWDTVANELAAVGDAEFKTLTIKVGYGENTPVENLGQIFTGSIRQVRMGRESATDNYVDVTAADGDHAYNFASVSATMALASPDSIAALLINSMAAIGGGTVPGKIPVFSVSSKLALTRGRTFYGSTKDELRDYAQDLDMVWSVQDNIVTFISSNGFGAGDRPIKLTPQTGLLGTPEQTQNGITARCLMNPNIKIASLIQLEATINRLRYSQDYMDVLLNSKSLLQNNLNAHNLYYVMWVEHTGDTRGTEWYSTMTCLAIDAHLMNPDLTGAMIAPVGPSIHY